MWKPWMKDILCCRDLCLIEGDETKLSIIFDSNWKKLNRKTGFIRQWIDNNILYHVSYETNAKSLWEKLKNLYERKTPQNKTSLIKRFVYLLYKDGSSLNEYEYVSEYFESNSEPSDSDQWWVAGLPLVEHYTRELG